MKETKMPENAAVKKERKPRTETVFDQDHDARKRVIFKKKLTELAVQKGFSFEKTEQLLSFVLDYMLLSEEMENEFIASSNI